MGRAVAEGLLAAASRRSSSTCRGRPGARRRHHELPVVDAPQRLNTISRFAALRDADGDERPPPLHAIDAPSALRRRQCGREIMRGEIGFDGLILSDDLSMKALSGSFEERAAAVIEAGLDIVLHCNGNMEEGCAVASATPMLSGASLRRAKAAAATIKAPQPFDVERGERELAAINAELGVA
jgi:beta-N-acetylhexosaminidase